MNQAILFTNWTDEDFSHNWDSIAYNFPAGQSMYLEANLANHFIKHLTNRELHKAGLMVDDQSRSAYENKCMGGTPIVADSATKLAQEVINENKKVDGAEEVVVPKKKAVAKKKKVEDEFEG